MAAQNSHVGVAHLLLEAGVDCNKGTTDIGTTPLFIAAQNGHVEIVRLLIKARTDTGVEPLHIAVEMGHVNVVCC